MIPGSSRLRRVTARRRTADDWLLVLVPPLYGALASFGWRVIEPLPPRSRLRRAVRVRLGLRTYGAFNRRDLPAFLGNFTSDAVYDTSHVPGGRNGRSTKATWGSRRWRATRSRPGISGSSWPRCVTSAETASWSWRTIE